MTTQFNMALTVEAPQALPIICTYPDVVSQPLARLTYVRAEIGKDDSGGPRGRIEGSPLVLVAAMKLMSGAQSRTRDAVSFPATQPNFEDLLMLMHRYPVHVEERSREAFDRGFRAVVENHRARAGMDREARGGAGIFKGQLLPFQRIGVDFMFGARRCLNADDMGLGKTVQAFGFLNEVNEFPAVIVVQAHVQRHWERKISEFLDAKRATGGLLDKAGTTWLPLHGSKPKTSVPHADIYVVHYLNLNGWVELLHSRGVRTVVFDEVQEGRHRGTRKFDAILRLSRFARNVVGLSGTPIYNRGAEIYTVMDVLSRGCLGMRTEFRNTWCSDKDPEVVEDPQALGRYLQDRGLMIRRRKEDVLTELPAKRRVFEHVDADNEQFAELVQEAAALARDATRLTDPFDRARMEAEAITKARRATGIAKAPAAAAFVRGLLEAGEPTLVFCHHHAVHDTLADALAEFRPASITGRETAGGKDISQKRFEDGETNLCLIALRAATGIDGLQKRARVVLFVELDWSPAIHKQAEDRAHRMGQHDSVLVYYLIADLGTDPDMLASLKLKESQFTGLMQDREETKEDREAAREASAEHKAAVLAMLRSIR
ncbi:DEAD/DEAH box helicase [Klebsiella pneumoniae]